MIHVEGRDAVVLASIDRPERRNAVDHAALVELKAALEHARDEHARVFILTGANATFCAGADLTGVEGGDFADALTAVLIGLTELPAVTIAAVEGPALGAGTQLAAACDLRVAHEAARFYAATFPQSAVTAVHKAPADYPSGKEGDVLTVEFTVAGVPCLGLNGGPLFRHSEAFSFQIATDSQEETDRYWNAIVGNGGQESECGWCKDRWGLSWQITPRVLTEALAAGGAEAKRAFAAMMSMKKIDVAAIEAARRG